MFYTARGYPWMQRYIKQLTQECCCRGCTKAFCRPVADIDVAKKISKILCKYGGSLLCKQITKLSQYSKISKKNEVLDMLFNIPAVNTDSPKQPHAFDHRHCRIIADAVDPADIYILTGVLCILLERFAMEPGFSISLIIVRLFNKIAGKDDFSEYHWNALHIAFKCIAEHVLHPSDNNQADCTTAMREVDCCGITCVFCLQFTTEDFTASLQAVTDLIDSGFPINFREDSRTNHLFEMLRCLYQINTQCRKVDDSAFVLNQLFNTINIKNEFKFCKLKFDSPLNYHFAMPIHIKAELLRLHHTECMKLSLQDAFFKALFQGITNPYLVINVRRDQIYHDTLRIVSKIDDVDAKKQLKVKFIGEDGVDSGGIKKEYFLLIGHEIENDIGTFVQTNNRIWFRKGVNQEILRTLGKLVGIALYNDVVLCAPFPSMLFKKLLGIPLTIDDLVEIEPEIHNTLRNLENCTAEELQFIDQNFTVDIEVMGRQVNYELKPQGADIKITRENLHEFIQLYSLFLMENAIEDEFDAFSDGFYSIIRFENVQNLGPRDLEMILIGCDELDVDEIMKVTTYDGYERTDQIVEDFWEFFNDLSAQKRRRLIQFITGNDRLPVSGSRTLNFAILKNGCDTERLPSSQTCFNTLLLPEYSSKEKLREKLGKAIDLTAGFFLM